MPPLPEPHGSTQAAYRAAADTNRRTAARDARQAAALLAIGLWAQRCSAYAEARSADEPHADVVLTAFDAA